MKKVCIVANYGNFVRSKRYTKEKLTKSPTVQMLPRQFDHQCISDPYTASKTVSDIFVGGKGQSGGMIKHYQWKDSDKDLYFHASAIVSTSFTDQQPDD